MIWLYRLQQRFALTGAETTAILTLSVLLLVGLVVRHVQRQPPVLPEGVYSEADRLFREGAAGPALPEGQGAPGDTAAAPVRAPSEGAAPAPGALRLNLNTATAAELERLPYVGPKTAQEIVAYREAHGPFRRVADVTRVRGIGAKTLARLEPFLFVDRPAE